MSNQVLGHIPSLSRISLIDGQDFAHTFGIVVPLESGSDLDGASISLEIVDVTRAYSYGEWPVVDLYVRIDASDHAVVPNGSWFRVWVVYPNDGGRFVWLAGPVERNRR